MFKHVTVIGKSTRNQLDKLTGLGVIGGHSLVGSAVETEYSQLYHKINRGKLYSDSLSWNRNATMFESVAG